MFKQDDIIRNGVALLAFVLAFYALVARERKTPYMVRSVYAIALIVLLSLLMSLASSIISSWDASGAARLQDLAGGLLGVGLVFILYRIWREQNRHVHFRDDQLLMNTRLVHWIRSVRGRFRTKPRYEHNPMNLSEPLINSLMKSPFLPADQMLDSLEHHKGAPELSLSVVVEIPTLLELDRMLTDVATRFLENDCFVQYTTCSRHPVEFLMQLESYWKNNARKDRDWKTVAKKVVVVDAYTPHFGFADTIHEQRTQRARGLCLDVVKSAPSYAGVHTAIAKAFNVIKKNEESGDLRSAALVVYEGCHALSDIESEEQYRVFVRHVLPSERLWGGMFTLFVETSISEDNLPILRGSADLFVSARTKDSVIQEKKKGG